MVTAKMLIFVLICVAVAYSAVIHNVAAQTLFSDNFDNPDESQKKWVDIYGQWEFKNNEYHQLQNAVNCMSLVSDEYWKDDWNDYTFELKANKISGAEGFLIMFRCMGKMQPRDVALRDHPQRMGNDKVSLQYWWNLGGWANVRSQVESWGGKAGANTNDTIKTDEWYDIKIVNTPKKYTLYLNGKEVASVDDDTQDGRGRVGLATWSTLARFDDVVVYGPNGISKMPVDREEKTAVTWAYIKCDR